MGIGLFIRPLVSGRTQPHKRANLVTKALRMAWPTRYPAHRRVHSSRRGSRYSSHSFQAAPASYRMRPSMCRKANCWDNVRMESLWGSPKIGPLGGNRFASAPGFIGPANFEANWHADQAKKATSPSNHGPRRTSARPVGVGIDDVRSMI